MNIRYKKKEGYLYLILGILLLANGFRNVIFSENIGWFDYIWFLFGILYLGSFFIQLSRKYLIIENGIIKQNWPFGKKLKLDEIKRIKHFGGVYILKTESKSMKIDIQAIDEKSLPDLKSELKKLNVQWD